MNRYGMMALTYTREYRPRAFAAIADPEAFFGGIGREIEAEVAGVRNANLRRPPGDLAAMSTAQRSSQASAMAEEIVLADHWLLTASPEPETEAEVDAEDDPVLAAHYEHLRLMNETMLALSTWDDD